MSMCFTASDPARAVQVVERLAHVAAAASGCLTGLAGAGLGGGGGVRVVGEVGLGEGLRGGGDRVVVPVGAAVGRGGVGGLAGDGGLASGEALDAARDEVLLQQLDGHDAVEGMGLGSGADRELLREQRIVASASAYASEVGGELAERGVRVRIGGGGGAVDRFN